MYVVLYLIGRALCVCQQTKYHHNSHKHSSFHCGPHSMCCYIYVDPLDICKASVSVLKKSDVFSCCCVMLVPGTKTTRQCNHVRRYKQWFAAPYSHSNVLLTSWVKTNPNAILTLGFSYMSQLLVLMSNSSVVQRHYPARWVSVYSRLVSVLEPCSLVCCRRHEVLATEEGQTERINHRGTDEWIRTATQELAKGSIS